MAENLLQRVSFGRADAESDDRLTEYFLKTGALQETIGGRQLVVGRKGSGKTALFVYLAPLLEESGTRAVKLDLNDYVWELHLQLQEAGMAGAQSYVSSWKLLIFLRVLTALEDSLNAEEKKTVAKVFKALGLNASTAGIGRVLGWISSVRRMELPSYTGPEFGASGGAIEIGDAAEKPFGTIVGAQVEILGAVLAGVYARKPFTVLVDRLDEAYDGSAESLALLGGAMRATRAINQVIPGNPTASVVAFLRSDIWDQLVFNDKNKMFEDMVQLNWDDAGLAEVVDLRISSTGGVSAGEGWGLLFTPEEMRQQLVLANTFSRGRWVGLGISLRSLAGQGSLRLRAGTRSSSETTSTKRKSTIPVTY